MKKKNQQRRRKKIARVGRSQSRALYTRKIIYLQMLFSKLKQSKVTTTTTTTKSIHPEAEAEQHGRFTAHLPFSRARLHFGSYLM